MQYKPIAKTFRKITYNIKYMAKKQKVKCKGKKGCGYEFAPTEVPTNKEWSLVSPMPDKDGNVTITMMATWTCPNCGKTVRGTLGKTKGQMSGKSKKEMLEEKLFSGETFEITELAAEMGYHMDNVEKMIEIYIKKGIAKGQIKGKKFVPA